MSDVFYPIAGVGKLRDVPNNRVLTDAFEDGGATTRYLWTDKTFKRRLTVSHGPITIQEFKTLRGFYTMRNGTYDSFWFRDNVNRGGNIKARFAVPMQREYEKQQREVAIELAEVAPLRPLPEWNEVQLATGGVEASAIYDPQRVVYFEHPGLSNFTEVKIPDSARAESWPLTFQSGSNALGGILTQYQHFDLGAAWARTTGNFTPITGSAPLCTVIAFLKRASGGTGRKGIVTLGATGAGNAMGIGYNAGVYEPYLGGSETWGTAKQSNSSGDTWRSIAVAWSGNVADFYVNAVLIGSESETRNYTAGPLTINAEPDGTDGDTVHKIGAVLVIPFTLTLAQVKAVHNLFCAHYGLATVA